MQISTHLHFPAIFEQLVSSFLIDLLAQPAAEVAVGKMANYKLMRERKTSAAEQYILSYCAVDKESTRKSNS